MILVWILSLPLAHSGSYFPHRVPFGRGFSVTLNQDYRSGVQAKLIPVKFLPRPSFFFHCLLSVIQLSLHTKLQGQGQWLKSQHSVKSMSRSYFLSSKRVSPGKGYTVIINQVSLFKVKVIANFCKILDQRICNKKITTRVSQIIDI